ncbi:MAG: GNAT family N-acetyltransferase [Caldilineaceae bacterium]
MNAIAIQKYMPHHWLALWQLRFAQLAEHGIFLSKDQIPAIPGLPENDEHEWDLNHIDAVYGSGGGGFWLAWLGDEPVGSVGAQDIGGVVELRRMYVKAAFRQQGIGRLLVQALVGHCRASGIHTAELWTDAGGMGQLFYKRLGFQPRQTPGPDFEAVAQATRRSPNSGEIRMRLVLYPQ